MFSPAKPPLVALADRPRAPRQGSVDSSEAAIAATRMCRLRDTTRAVHARVEASLPLLDRRLTLTRYARLLEAFYGFYAPLEPQLARASATEGRAVSLDLRGKVPLLVRDLLALGRSVADIETIPQCAELELPRLTVPSHAMGALYVVEGATLGGQIIGRHLRAGLGIDATSGAAFFSGYGERTGEMWTRLSQHVDSSLTIDTDALLSGALDTFEKLESWLARSGASA